MRFFKKHPIITIILCIFSFSIYQKYTKVVDYHRNREINSRHFINELYTSDERIYYEYLSEEDKKMYDLLLNSSKKYHSRVNIDLDEYNCYDYHDCADFISTANSALYVDHPELMNYSGYHWRYYNNTFTLYLDQAYKNPLKDVTGVLRTEKVISEIEKNTKNMTEEEKIKYVYDWLGENNHYDYLFFFASKNQSIYNVFVKKKAVCSGFAKASQIIFQNLGIESFIVEGESNGHHMWNIVKYNNKYYYFDSTVAVGVHNKENSHYYDGLKQEEMNDYQIRFKEWYPEIESTNMFDNL